MPDLHELLAVEASRGGPVPAPPFETLVARSRRRRAKQALALTSVVAAVTASIVVPSVVSHHRTAVVVAGTGGATTAAARKAITERAAEQLVAEVQLPPGAIAQSGPPTPALSQVFNYPGPQNVVDVVRYFTVPGDMYTVIAYTADRPPPGTVENFTFGGDESGGGGAGITDVGGAQGIAFAGQPTHDFGPPTVLMAATTFGSQVAVRVEAQLVWRPLRTSAENAPVKARSVTACYGGLDCPLSVLDAAAARELAAYFNSLDTQAQDPSFDCSQSTPYATFTFDGSAGPLTFSVSRCGAVGVTVNDVPQPTLDTTAQAIDPQLQHLLGLESVAVSSGTAAVASGGPPAIH